MTEAIMSHQDIENISRLVQNAFIDMRKSITNNTLNEEQRAAIKSLPHDRITKSADNRLRKFPNDCCMDASFVLAIIFTAIAEQNDYKFVQLMHIRCRPTEKTKTVMFDVHQWLRVDGYDVDITFKQCRIVSKGRENEIVFNTHPLIGSDDYIFEGGEAGIEEAFTEFANYIITNYFNKKGS